MKAKQVKKILGITQTTLSKYVKKGKIKFHKINQWSYIYEDESVYALIGKKVKKGEKIVSYSRVSTSIQKNQLKEQTQRIYEWATSNGFSLNEQIEDIKSGMNFERNGFNKLIQQIIQGEIKLVIIENKDRLVRFGFELIEQLCKYYGTKILIINNEIQNKSYEQELTEDLLSIIHYFSMKSYSHRRKLNKLKKEIETDNV